MSLLMRVSFNQNKKAPCLDCKDRTVGCHGVCGTYKSFRNELDGVNKTTKKNKTQEQNYLNYIR